MRGRRPGSPTRNPQPRVLVVEDDSGIAALVAYQLTRAGYRVETAAGGAAGLEAIHRDIPDLVVLDRMLPEISGDEVLRTIRGDPVMRSIAVLVLTAKREEEERIEGLEMGADDYLTKPFSPQELVLRVDAILKRALPGGTSPTKGARVLTAGPLTVDPDGIRVSLDGEEVPVTPTEFRILTSLVEHRGRTRTRTQLLQEAWDTEAEVATRIRTRTVDMHVRRLRTKLREAGKWIETVRGFGYRFRPPDG